MASLQRPRFTQLVVDTMRELYPEELADRTWDNVGLLQDNIQPDSGSVPPRVLLTNDLTPDVAEEAIQKNVSVIVTYHPFIFRGLKSITLPDPQQSTILRLARANIAVYSPHTAVDAAPGGVNDWLANLLDQYPLVIEDFSVIQPAASKPDHVPYAGYGRLVTLRTETDLETVVAIYAQKLGLRGVLVARPKNPRPVKTIAFCAGSGYDVVKDAEADLVVTGEVSHHNALRLKMLGRSVLAVCHSNSERGWLREVLKEKLTEELKGTVPEVEVLVSEEDQDPLEFWAVEE
ncbi:hypothetical protein VTJ04DRAFT_7137 [Mycothermus thermophilus]|uniref:uncharacterized protein n=1 Tax=Humicola insolens TaxID=85995 RepID=UPI003743BB16